MNPLPSGLIIRGSNIVGADSTWIEMVENWSTQWPNYIKPQLDLMKAMGCNVVRAITGISGITQGNYTRAQFLATYEQLVQYSASIGLYVYATCGDSLYVTGTTSAAIFNLKPEVMAMIQMLDNYDNVVAIDMWNEFFNAQEPHANTINLDLAARHAMAQDWTTSARALTSKPLTWSLPSPNTNDSAAMWTGSTNMGSLATSLTYMDFIDQHIYYAAVPSEMTAYVAALNGTQMIIGEVGYNILESDSVRSANYASVKLLVDTYSLGGALAWAAFDGFSPDFFGGHPEWNFGLYQHDFSPYPGIIAAVQTWSQSGVYVPFVPPVEPITGTQYSRSDDTYQVSLYKIANNFYRYAISLGYSGNEPNPSSAPQQLLSNIVDYTSFLT